MKNILKFLQTLKKNNNREWFLQNKEFFESTKNNFVDIVETLIAGIAKHDKGIAGLQAKDSIFRIYRDIRFSKDKTPYKTNFGANMTPGGKKSGKTGYYIHIEPGGGSFLAGGIYMPPSEQLKAVRQEIDYNIDEFKKIIQDKNFVKYFGSVTGEKLKKAPQGYPPDHPNIELLKFKSYIVMHKVKDTQLLDEGFIKYAVDVFGAMQPFNWFLNRAVVN
ncbi:MAG: DUF2461 domain-containing protein [Cytophagales bacterium]|nr:DUF2461 domain-containing protein [Cytophagales bacterium]